MMIGLIKTNKKHLAPRTPLGFGLFLRNDTLKSIGISLVVGTLYSHVPLVKFFPFTGSYFIFKKFDQILVLINVFFIN